MMVSKKTVAKRVGEKNAAKKTAAKKATAKNAAAKKTVKSAAKKSAAKRTVKKRPPRRQFSIAKLKQSINSKATKVIIALSFVSAVFPSTYEWGSDQLSQAVAVAQPVVATYTEEAIKQTISATPLAKTAAGVWVAGQAGRLTAPAYNDEQRAQQPSRATSKKVDVIANPFY